MRSRVRRIERIERLKKAPVTIGPYDEVYRYVRSEDLRETLEERRKLAEFVIFAYEHWPKGHFGNFELNEMAQSLMKGNRRGSQASHKRPVSGGSVRPR